VDLDVVRKIETDGMTEAHLQYAVEQIATLNGWEHHHTPDSRRSRSGYPDLTLVRPPRLVFAELKSMRGRLSDRQKVWRDQLIEADQEWYLWRPSDLEEIVMLLGHDMTTREQWSSYSSPPKDAA
jgi:hypothetical protein